MKDGRIQIVFASIIFGTKVIVAAATNRSFMVNDGKCVKFHKILFNNRSQVHCYLPTLQGCGEEKEGVGGRKVVGRGKGVLAFCAKHVIN